MDQNKARSLFRETLRIRSVEEEVARLYPEQEMRCPVHLSVGQEATPVGVCSQLKTEDYMVSTHRAHAHYLAKGGNLNALIGELYGRVTGCTRGQGGSMHLIDLSQNFIAATSIVGGTIPVGVGAALSAQLKGEKRVSVVCIGDTAVEEGVFHESMNFAALRKLPVIFMCENNNYSCYSPIENRQPKRDLLDVALAHKVYSKKLDGNNVFEVSSGMAEIVDMVRNGHGPAFVEFPTFRYLEHCGPHNDDSLAYRPADEIKNGHKDDAIVNAREYLKSAKFYDEAWESKITKEINEEIKEAFESAKNAPYPDKSELGAYTYGN